MEDQTRDLLNERIVNQFNNLADLNPSEKEYSMAINDLETLYKLKIEETKLNWEYDEKYNRRMMEKDQYERDTLLKEQQVKSEIDQRVNENCQKTEQLKEQKLDRYFKYGVEAGLGLATLIFYSHWMKKGFKFEETGTFTSRTFQSLFQKFKPTRK